VSGRIQVSGWAVAEAGIESVQARVDGLPIASGRTGLPRPDVARAFSTLADAGRAGFALPLDASLLESGPHSLELEIRAADGETRTLAGTILVDNHGWSEISETGERVIPDRAPHARGTLEHMARYRFVERWVHGGRWLDLGTGAGYGAEILAGSAGAVVGIDLDPETLRYAATRYPAARYACMQGDRLALADATFDGVVCLEVIEHVADPAALLRDVARVLRPGGLFVLSTPNAAAAPAGRPANPFHVRELDEAELRRLLAAAFADVRLYGQGYLAGVDFHMLEPGGASEPASIVTHEAVPGTPLFLLAICGGVAPALPSETFLATHGQFFTQAVAEPVPAADRLDAESRVVAEANLTLKAERVVLERRAAALERQLRQAEAEREAWSLRPTGRLRVLAGALGIRRGREVARTLLGGEAAADAGPTGAAPAVAAPADAAPADPGSARIEAAFTIVSRNYLAYARVLTRTFLRHHPGARMFVVLCDRSDGFIDPAAEPFELIEIHELGIPDFEPFCFKYDVTELNTAVKPFAIERIFDLTGAANLVFFDPDIVVARPLTELADLLTGYSIVLIPHMLQPVRDGRRPGEIEILRAGAYNLGFVALRDGDTTRRLLAWLKDRLYDGCRNAPDEGLFVDQKWMDLVPGMFPDTFVLRDPSYDVAYWNLHERRLQIVGDGFHVNGRPLSFYHFSGVDPLNPTHISRHQDRFSLDSRPDLRPLFEAYCDALRAEGHDEQRGWPYAYGFFDNGVRIPEIARRLFTQLGPDAHRFGDPYRTAGEDSFFAWLVADVESEPHPAPTVSRLLEAIWRRREDVRAAYPDPLGADRTGFATWARTSGPLECGLDAPFLPADDGSLAPRRGRVWTLHLQRALRARRIHEAGLRLHLLVGGRRMRPLQRVYARGVGLVERALGIPPPGPDVETARLLADEGLPGATGEANGGGRGVAAAPRRLSIRRTRVRRGAPGANVIGYVTAESGVGEGARSTIRALTAAGLDVAVNDFRVNNVSRMKEVAGARLSRTNPHPVNILHVNADQVPVLRAAVPETYFEGRYNVGFWYWELSTFPSRWQASFEPLDEVWAASRFVADAVRAATRLPVRALLPAIEPVVAGGDGRAALGLAPDAFVFLCVFDFLSVFERKNPLGAVRAFERAFEGRDDVALVLKCVNSHHDRANFHRVQAAAGPRVRILEGYLERPQLNALTAAADCLVSLHRSEGFGLPLAEAMALGTPTLATAYSGNMDFMTEENSYLVGFKPIELEQAHGPYDAGSVWAEPDLDHAAELMARVERERDEAAERARRAVADARRLMSAAAAGARLRARLDEIAAERGLWRAPLRPAAAAEPGA
jgi:2-polyprenyl-3-methyl-5-hydroxy-6-metoxy-1,4-benzoquinol methylase/glycosyltransferase involved in cell wall biosynthesis